MGGKLKNKIYPGDKAPQHGLNGYSNYRCRCTICRTAWYKYMHHLREVRFARMVVGEIHPDHGKYTTYTNYKCRCTDCKHAATRRNNDYKERVRARKKARSDEAG